MRKEKSEIGIIRRTTVHSICQIRYSCPPAPVNVDPTRVATYFSHLRPVRNITTSTTHEIQPSDATTIRSRIFWKAFARPVPSSRSDATFLALSISTPITPLEYSKLPVLSIYATA